MAARRPLPTAPPRRAREWILVADHGLRSPYVPAAARCVDGAGGSGCARPSLAASPPVSGGSGGSRPPLRRVPPVRGLDAQERVQVDALQLAKNDQHQTDAVLSYMKTLRCGILDCTTFSEKIKSCADLPVLFDEQFCKDNKCKGCGSPQNIDLLLSNTPHFLTIVFNWLGSSERQDTLSEVLSGITFPVDTGFFCKSVNSSTMYAVTSMKNDQHQTDAVLSYMKTLRCGILDRTTFSEKEQVLDREDTYEIHRLVDTVKRVSKEYINLGWTIDIWRSYTAFRKLTKKVMGWKTQGRWKRRTSFNSYREEKLLEFIRNYKTTEDILNWLRSSERQDTLSEVLAGITSPVDTGFFCKSADSSTMCAVISLICCPDESCICFVCDDEDKWLIYDFETVETEDTWEHLLERFKHCKSGAFLHKLDAGSPQTTEIKSFAELPVLLDERDQVLNWLGSSESQDTLSEVLAGIMSPVDTGFFCKSADSSTMYAVTSMICCVDESYVCFARDDEDKWLIYGFETVRQKILRSIW